MTRIADLQDRLLRLARRREDEGIYTDANLVEAASARIAALEAKLAAAQKALEFYANRENWKNGRFEQAEGGTVLRHHPSSVHKDRGAKARAVLGGKP